MTVVTSPKKTLAYTGANSAGLLGMAVGLIIVGFGLFGFSLRMKHQA
jgi:hypothetical protein